MKPPKRQRQSTCTNRSARNQRTTRRSMARVTMAVASPAMIPTREVAVTTEVLSPLEGLTKRELAGCQDYVSVMRNNLHILERALGCPGS